MSKQQYGDTSDGITGVGPTGSPYAPNTGEDVEVMLEAIGAESVEELFDIPDSIRYDEEFSIESMSEQGIKRELELILGQNASQTSFLGRNHYSHYIPSIVDHISLRSEYITSYTQYQPEITQGFLQVLFEYQSLLSELTGLGIANSSMYDAATALGEAATLSSRLRKTTGTQILVPEYIRDADLSVLENYIQGTELSVEQFETSGGMIDPGSLEETFSEDVAMVYAENPTVNGLIEEHLDEIGTLADDNGALFCLGSDIVALSLLQRPVDIGADIVIGDASVLGLPPANGMGLGIFACREDFLRQVPGRLVGASTNKDGDRAYTLTLQTREQHIRRERATSNICTNQAWVALRTAIHASSLGPTGLMSLAEECHQLAEETARELDDLDGVSAPVHDGYHFREFKARVDDAESLVESLRERGLSVHATSDDEIQVCVSDRNNHQTAALVAAIEEEIQ